ncbi:hypothetical protein ACJJTC_008642 [Scirpophaga incertulas]
MKRRGRNLVDLVVKNVVVEERKALKESTKNIFNLYTVTTAAAGCGAPPKRAANMTDIGRRRRPCRRPSPAPRRSAREEMLQGLDADPWGRPFKAAPGPAPRARGSRRHHHGPPTSSIGLWPVFSPPASEFTSSGHAPGVRRGDTGGSSSSSN